LTAGGTRDGEALSRLRTAAAVRERCAIVYGAGLADRLAHFAIVEDRLDAATAYTIETMRAAYPTLAIPLHSRWRHFEAGGIDRWAAFRAGLTQRSSDEIARLQIDLAVVSVLLDAGAGPDWRYREAETGQTYARSEGLGVASFRLFTGPAFAGRADAETLGSVDAGGLAAAFQANAANPLVGIAGRAALLDRLGRAIAVAPAFFGTPPRVGNLFDYFRARAAGRPLPAASILAVLLDALADVWPSATAVDGIALGDVGRHPAVRTDDASNGLVPFHKLSQWLAYSLVEPLEAGGIAVADLDGLTGLAEYRNGGLFVDLGVLVPKAPAALREVHAVGSELVVEWRALTLACLDRIADRVRAQIGRTALEFPLAKVLEGGTWRAGRRIALTRRAGGAPPIRVASDGTVF
jgi:hypothetical protein